MSSAKGSKGSTKRRFSTSAIVEVALIVIAVAVILAIVIPKLTSNGNGTHDLTYKQQVLNSVQSTKTIGDTFMTAYRSCTNATCVDNAATNAVNSMGTVLNSFNVNNFPTRAQQSSGTYVHDLNIMQRLYLSLSFLNSMKAIRQSVNLVPTNVKATLKSGREAAKTF